MKTIAQAYKELKGDLDNTKLLVGDELSVEYLINTKEYVCTYASTGGFSDIHQYICTVEEFNNYKGDSMKTVRDAVIEFKAEWPAGYIMSVCVNDNEVCYGEFNTYVDLLTSNIGRATQTYAEYKKEFEYMTTPTKVDYNSEEFWADAPEGAEFHQVDDDDYLEAWLKNVTPKGYEIMIHDENEWTKCNYPSDAEKDGKLIPRPQPKPIYTQSMSDNGELPSVGMECEYKERGGINWRKCKIIAIHCEKVWLINTDHTTPLNNISSLGFRSLTPPIKLIDGKAYQFDWCAMAGCSTHTEQGLYSEKLSSMVSLKGSTCITQCSNIKPLTVEVK